jgi:putative ABC transport system ATP-binding protein
MSKQKQVVVEVTGLSKAYTSGGTRVAILSDLKLSIQRGESVAILGVSGTGKSTLLNILSGIDSIDGGMVSIDGEDIAKLDAAGLARYRRSKVGFVFQFYNLIPTLTALENVMTGWEAAGKPAKEGKQAALSILAALDLSAKADRFPEQLSGGEQQRVAIARALVKRPALVLADEPTGNLDPKTAASTTQLLLDQARQFASALIIVTHNPLIGQHTDRTLVLHNGALEEQTPLRPRATTPAVSSSAAVPLFTAQVQAA